MGLSPLLSIHLPSTLILETANNSYPAGLVFPSARVLSRMYLRFQGAQVGLASPISVLRPVEAFALATALHSPRSLLRCLRRGVR